MREGRRGTGGGDSRVRTWHPQLACDITTEKTGNWGIGRVRSTVGDIWALSGSLFQLGKRDQAKKEPPPPYPTSLSTRNLISSFVFSNLSSIWCSLWLRLFSRTLLTVWVADLKWHVFPHAVSPLCCSLLSVSVFLFACVSAPHPLTLTLHFQWVWSKKQWIRTDMQTHIRVCPFPPSRQRFKQISSMQKLIL